MTEKPKRKNSLFHYQELKDLPPCMMVIVVVLFFICSALNWYLKVGWRSFEQPSVQEHCELAVTDTIRLQIEAYVCEACEQTRYRYYQISRDAGLTWRTFHRHQKEDDPLIADCNEFQVFSAEKISLLPTTYYGSYFMVTNDGGETWHTWFPDDLPRDFECFTIDEVNFQDALNGYMVLDCNRYRHRSNQYLRQENLYLTTEDGGLTWDSIYD